MTERKFHESIEYTCLSYGSNV